MNRRNQESISKNARSGIYFWGWLAVLCAIPMVAVAQDGWIGQVAVPSMIVGECDCDSSTCQTTCTYTVFSGTPALSHLLFPIPVNCAELFAVSSPYYSFSDPQTYLDRFCGEIYGIKADQELTEGQTTTFTITYNGISPLGIGIVYTSLKGGPNCQAFPVQGVVDCIPVPHIKWYLDATECVFRIRKPGIFAAELASMMVESNTQVNISFASFGDLQAQGLGSGSLPAFYAVTPPEQPQPPPEFLPPEEFNSQVLIVPADEEEFRFSIWGKIVVNPQATACEYLDAATITLVLENLETWVDDGN